MNKYDIIIEIQRIINNYKQFPRVSSVKESLLEEVSSLIGRNATSLEDIKYITEHIDISEWENVI
jgi:hypothetical protein